MKNALSVIRLCFDISFRGTTIGAGTFGGMRRGGDCHVDHHTCGSRHFDRCRGFHPRTGFRNFAFLVAIGFGSVAFADGSSVIAAILFGVAILSLMEIGYLAGVFLSGFCDAVPGCGKTIPLQIVSRPPVSARKANIDIESAA